MHDLLVGNAISYSRVVLPERQAFIWCQISTPFFSFHNNAAVVFLFISPRKRYCENTLKVPNLILITSLCKTGRRRRRMKTNR